MRVALATCTELPAGDDDAAVLDAALADCGVESVWAVWDDPGVDWDRFELVVVRATWDYAERRDEFLAWAAALPRVENRLEVLRWSTDKEQYLSALAHVGVPTVPTIFLRPGDTYVPPSLPFVVKPSVSAGGRLSARFDAGGAELVARIHAEGRTAMIQPFIGGADEHALVFIDGRYSHALVRRVPLPEGDHTGELYLDETLLQYQATKHEIELAQAALAVAPPDLLYARVDLLGEAVLELELAEPSLYLAFGDGSAQALASAIARRLGPGTTGLR